MGDYLLGIIGTLNVVSAIACVFAAEKRGGNSFVWLINGLVFGFFAFIIALTAGKKCKHCLMIMPKDAGVCGNCGRDN